MYEIKFKQLAVKAENLEDHVKMLNQIQSENIKPRDLTMEKLIELLARMEEVKTKQSRRILREDPYVGVTQVSKRPPEIWAVFHEHFGPDYFLECIEEEYGIERGENRRVQAKIDRFFAEQINAFRVELHSNTKNQYEIN